MFTYPNIDRAQHLGFCLVECSNKFILYVDLRAIHELFILFAMQFLFLGFFPIWPAHFILENIIYLYLFILFIESSRGSWCINRK